MQELLTDLSLNPDIPLYIMDRITEVLLEKGQVLVPHPNQYFPETGYLACGDSVLVTDIGMERLSETETRLYVKEVR